MLKFLAFSSLMLLAAAKNWCCHPPSTRQAVLDLIVKDNDHDGNGYVSGADITYDMQNYDENKDNIVTVYEWVKRWDCRYGLDMDFSQWVFGTITNGTDLVNIAQMRLFPDPGMPDQAFRAMNAKRFTTYANLPKS